MNHLEEKINKIKWLKAIGVQYTYTKTKNLFNEEPNQAPNESINEKTSKSTRTKAGLIKDNQHNPMTIEKIEATKLSIKGLSKGLLAGHMSEAASAAAEIADKVTDIKGLKEAVMGFDLCNLKKLSNNTVFSDGVEQASVMLIGEAPGANEDKEGIPFCGESGQLLDKMLATIGISRQTNAYITNTIFWRPPANRVPTNEEIEMCRPFVEKHIALIKPKLIILVGNTAVLSLLGKDTSVSKIRQNFYPYENKHLKEPISLTAIFHPAYLLRQPMQKKTVWYDLIKIQEFLKG